MGIVGPYNSEGDFMDLHDIETEKNILGACLLSNKAIDTVSEILIPDNFYKASHQRIFNCIMVMWGKKYPVDLSTLVNELRKEKEIDIVGGAAYIASLTDSIPSASNVSHYCNIVKEFAQKRKMFNMGQYLMQVTQDASSDIPDIKTEVEKMLLEMENKTKSGYQLVKNHIVEVIKDIVVDFNRKGQIKGIPTGISELDRLTNGWQDGDYIVIGARPSVGKTASVVQMIIHGAIMNNKKIGFFSAEMGAKQIIRRMISNVGHINQTNMRSGMLTSTDFASIQDAAGQLYESQIFINDTPNIQSSELISEARRMKRQEGVQAIYIDYLGLLTYSNKKMARWEQIGEISRALKGLARELNIPIIVLSQLTRDKEGKRPNMADLRDSGSVEQDADGILLLHREGDPGESVDEIEMILCKQRNGPIGSIAITHQKAFSKMTNRISS
jgi:replicative DNA helicase